MDLEETGSSNWGKVGYLGVGTQWYRFWGSFFFLGSGGSLGSKVFFSVIPMGLGLRRLGLGVG